MEERTARLDSKVSVCMAVHNGERFLRTQVESICRQLRPDDELVAVDDASTDGSVSILESILDPRIRVYRNSANAGVLATFERALMLASGAVLFLSDQDDVWLPGKLAKSLEALASDPRVTMVASDATIIDDEGKTVGSSFFSQRGRFVPGFVGNFIKNKYLGCTLSFRREMLSVFLPIPPDVPMHDIWFGALNSIYGRTCFIDEPLVAYRRHARNASPIVSPGPAMAARWRYRLAKNIARRVIDRTIGAK